MSKKYKVEFMQVINKGARMLLKNTCRILACGGLISILLSGCAQQMQPSPLSANQVVDAKSRVAIAALIDTVNQIEEQGVANHAQIETLSKNTKKLTIELNDVFARISALEQKLQSKSIIADTTKAKNINSELAVATGEPYRMYATIDNVMVRACPEKSCKSKDVFLKGHIFSGFDNGDGWVQIKNGTFVFGKYVQVLSKEK